jgi:hypothetical protein
LCLNTEIKSDRILLSHMARNLKNKNDGIGHSI